LSACMSVNQCGLWRRTPPTKSCHEPRDGSGAWTRLCTSSQIRSCSERARIVAKFYCHFRSDTRLRTRGNAEVSGPTRVRARVRPEGEPDRATGVASAHAGEAGVAHCFWRGARACGERASHLLTCKRSDPVRRGGATGRTPEASRRRATACHGRRARAGAPAPPGAAPTRGCEPCRP